ncbi:hypothetical protein XENOCAPTIV_026802, partial [Xenoophorus captivus]
SLDYDRCINEPYVEVLEGMDNKKARKYEAVRWVMVFVIGVTVGLVGKVTNPGFLCSSCCSETENLPSVSFRLDCLWNSLCISLLKSNSPWLVIVSFSIAQHSII